MMQRMEEGRFADILRRDCISRDELLDFFEGEKAIKIIDLPDSNISAEVKSYQRQHVSTRSRSNLHL